MEGRMRAEGRDNGKGGVSRARGRWENLVVYMR